MYPSLTCLCLGLTLALLLLAAATAARGQNPFVIQMPDELRYRERELCGYLREKPGFREEMDKIFLDLKNAIDADTYPGQGNRDHQVSWEEARRQIMRLPSNRTEYGGKPAALQAAAEGVIAGWEHKYPDSRPGDRIFDLNHAIRNKMQTLGPKYSEEFCRISRHYDDYRKHILANAGDPQYLPKFNPADATFQSKQALKIAEAKFDKDMKDQVSREKKLAERPPTPADLLQFMWYRLTTAP